MQSGFGSRMGVFCEDPKGLANGIIEDRAGSLSKIRRFTSHYSLTLHNKSEVLFFKKGRDNNRSYLKGYRFNTILVEGDRLSTKEQEIILPQLGICFDPYLFEKYDIPKEWGIKEYPELIFSGEGEIPQD